MPNGSHGGGEISRDELLRFFDSLQDDLVVGQLVVAQVGDRLLPLEDRREVAVADVRDLIQTEDQRWFLFEAVDHPQARAELVIHLCTYDHGPEAIKNQPQSGRLRWLYVTEDRPVFQGLAKLWLDVLARSRPDK